MGQPSWLLVVLVCLATYRVTRFITADAFPLIAVPRRWIDKHWNPFPSEDAWSSYKEAPPEAKKIVQDGLRRQLGIRSRPTGLKRSLAYLIGCAWCTSIWVAAGCVGLVMLTVGLGSMWALLLWLTASAVTGMIAQREPE